MATANRNARLSAYLDDLCSVLGHADHAAGLRGYCSGLMLPLERKGRSDQCTLKPGLARDLQRLLALALAAVALEERRQREARLELYADYSRHPIFGVCGRSIGQHALTLDATALKDRANQVLISRTGGFSC